MNYFHLLLFSFWASLAVAQGSIEGILIDANTEQPLISASVFVKGTAKGTVSDFDGYFRLSGLNEGPKTLVFSYLGYEAIEKEVDIKAGEPLELGQISLSPSSVGIEEVKVIASLAIDRKTPVAVSSVDADYIEDKLGNQEFPEILRNTPSIYATKSGGGWGDARINVRGFDQRNTAVLINGIPVNDMENGWVYWSNWAGLSEVTRQMQVQRGLGASRLAISSIGGTINIITRTTDQKKGGSFTSMVGNDGYLRNALTLSTGRLKGGWAITVSGAYTQGNGYIDGTSFLGGSYFASIAKEFGEKHRLVFTAIGAPQSHGQRTFRESLMTYDSIRDYRYNSDWGYLDGKEYNMRRNFYHKPQMALNHYWTINEKLFLSTSAYYSVGRGGGTGDRGSIDGRGSWGYRDDQGLLRMDDIVAWNQGSDNISGFPSSGKYQVAGLGSVAGENDGLIRRTSVNSHNWAGLLSNLTYNINEQFTASGGVDLRYYKGIHYREVNDLLGNDYWLDSRDINAQSDSVDLNGDGQIDRRERGALKKEGDKIQYYNDGVVGWQGVFGQLEYDNQSGLTAFFSGALSNTSYKRVDYFQYEEGNQESESYNFLGYTAKAGANYNINKAHNVFANIGYFSRAPIFDVVFPNYNNDANEEAKNENTFGAEIGYGLRLQKVMANVNLYHTRWMDKSFIRGYQDSQGDNFTANLTGLNAIHQGIEIDGKALLAKDLYLTFMASFGDWQWTNNVEALISDDNNVVIDTAFVYAKGLKVGDAAQTTMSLGLEYKLPFGLQLDANYYYAANLYANFDPVDYNSSAAEGRQALKLPSYGLLNGGIGYRFAFNKVALKLRANVNNILDTKYVAEADNFYAPNMGNEQMLQSATGFYGFGRTWNIALKLEF